MAVLEFLVEAKRPKMGSRAFIGASVAGAKMSVPWRRDANFVKKKGLGLSKKETQESGRQKVAVRVCKSQPHSWPGKRRLGWWF